MALFLMDCPSVLAVTRCARAGHVTREGGFADDVVQGSDGQPAGNDSGACLVSVLDDFHPIASLTSVQSVGPVAYYGPSLVPTKDKSSSVKDRLKTQKIPNRQGRMDAPAWVSKFSRWA